MPIAPARLPLLVLVLLGSVLASGCRSTETADDPEAAAVVPADFYLVFGQGGGFTGRWEGYAVQADGAVRAWSGMAGAEDTTAVGRLSTARMDTLWRHIREAAYFEQEREDVGNVTAFMELTADGRTHRVSWIPRVEGVEPITDPVEALYVQCRTLARSAGEQ